MISQPVWFSVLALSEASMNLLRPLSSLVITDKTLGAPATPEAQLDITTLAFLHVMDESRKCISNISGAWSAQRGCDRDLLDSLGSQTVGRNLNSAIYWLFIRLGKYFHGRLLCEERISKNKTTFRTRSCSSYGYRYPSSFVSISAILDW